MTGSFCFAELCTPDLARSRRFYQGMFGWTVAEAFFQRDGRDAAGLRGDDRKPHTWVSYLAVESADRAAARATELGAVLLEPLSDRPGIARVGLLRDPAETVVGLWEARGHPGSRIAGEPGAIWWHEMVAHDVPAARAFYCELMGWTARETRVPAGDYTILEREGRGAAGLMAIGPDWGPVRPHWQVFFQVDDCDAALARAVKLGGAVVVGPVDVAGSGRFAVLADPGNAIFAIMKPESAG